MAQLVGPSLVAKSKNLYFSTTQTLRNEKISISSVNANFVIDIHGQIHQNSEPQPDTATIVLEGGLDTFVNEKENRDPIFYITQKQKNTVYAILRELSILTDTGQVTSQTSEVLDRLVSSAYFNYCG